MNKTNLIIKQFNKLQCLRTIVTINENSRLLQRNHVKQSAVTMKFLPPQHIIARFNHTAALKCWNCSTNINSITSLTCDNCQVIQRPHSKNNYFEVFDLKEDFNLDQKLLTKKYRQLQTVLHPDKFANKSEQEKEISAEYSSLVNKAYNTLQVPMSRAVHMLKLHDITIDDEAKASDPEFLMEIMELNEEVEEADTPDKLRAFNMKNNRVLEACGKEISKYFNEDDIERAKNSVIKMKYYNSIKTHIDKLMREQGVVD